MSGTKAGGLKAAATNRSKYGASFYRAIGRKGGRSGHTGGFAANPELARIVGAKGGANSNRSCSIETIKAGGLGSYLGEDVLAYMSQLPYLHKQIFPDDIHYNIPIPVEDNPNPYFVLKRFIVKDDYENHQTTYNRVLVTTAYCRFIRDNSPRANFNKAQRVATTISTILRDIVKNMPEESMITTPCTASVDKICEEHNKLLKKQLAEAPIGS